MAFAYDEEMIECRSDSGRVSRREREAVLRGDNLEIRRNGREDAGFLSEYRFQ